MSINVATSKVPLEQYGAIQFLNDYICENYPFMQNIVEQSFEKFGDEWLKKFELTLSTLLSDKETLINSIDGYANFAMDALRLHRKFEKTRVYEKTSYSTAAEDVYHNVEYMQKLYLPGILLSHFLWPHHYRQRLFFEKIFLPEISRIKPKSFNDVGIGTGYYSRLLLSALPDITGKGYDISTSSRDYTLKQVKAFGYEKRYDVELKNVCEHEIPAADCVMSIEVLEHLEDPVSFLRALERMLKPGGKAFVTAALNAPNEDHIYLYTTAEQVYEQCVEAGFTVEQYQYCAAYKPRKPGIPVPEIAAFILSK